MADRAKVFVSPDGEEWRAVDGRLQIRMHEEDESRYPLEPGFGGAFHGDNDAWIAFLRSRFPRSVASALLALANPMTVAESLRDDEQIAAGALPERAVECD